MRSLNVVSLFVLLLCVAEGCTSVDCPLNNRVALSVAFLTADNAADTLKDTLTVATTKRDGQDSVLLNKITKQTELSLPVSYMGEEDVFYFTFSNVDGTKTDVLRLKKTNTPHFESIDCAPSYFHTIQSAEFDGTMVDSVRINNPELNYDNTKKHLLVYLRPRL